MNSVNDRESDIYVQGLRIVLVSPYSYFTGLSKTCARFDSVRSTSKSLVLSYLHILISYVFTRVIGQ